MTTRRIELVYFEGCPHAVKARENIKSALEAAGQEAHWSEWDLEAESTPDRYRQHGSPTVLIDGHDVTGDGHGAIAMACRADGAPSASLIAERLG